MTAQLQRDGRGADSGRHLPQPADPPDVLEPDVQAHPRAGLAADLQLRRARRFSSWSTATPAGWPASIRRARGRSRCSSLLALIVAADLPLASGLTIVSARSRHRRRRASSGRTSPTRCSRRGHDVTVLDDLSGGFTDNVPGAARFVQGSVTDAASVDRLFADGRVRLRLPPRRLRRRGPEPLHQALQLHEQRHRQRQPDQRVDQHRRARASSSPRRSPSTAAPPAADARGRPRRIPRIPTASPSSRSSRSSGRRREMFGLAT